MRNLWKRFDPLLETEPALDEGDFGLLLVKEQTGPRHSWGPSADLDAPFRRELLEKILVATDFSPASDKALRWGIGMASQYDSVLGVLHVININTQSEEGTAQETMGRLWRHSSAQMGNLAASLCGQVDAETMLEQGLPWERIVVKSRDFDLLILGQQRRSGWNLFSSQTVQQVLEKAVCPVVVVR